MKLNRFALTLALALPLAAQAIEYNQIVPNKSRVIFAYKQMGVAMDGEFKKFSAQMSFDPEKVASAKVSFDVDLASADAGSDDADQELGGKVWFNVKVFPTAQFASSSVKTLGANRYELAGKLSIKGKAQNIVIPLTMTNQGNAAVFDGHFTIRRSDFSVGEGPWSAFDVVANDVQVKLHITAAGK